MENVGASKIDPDSPPPGAPDTRASLLVDYENCSVSRRQLDGAVDHLDRLWGTHVEPFVLYTKRSSKLDALIDYIGSQQVPPARKGKNAVDIALTVKAMDLRLVSRIKHIAILSGDSDFTPLVRFLQSWRTAVVGVVPDPPPIVASEYAKTVDSWLIVSKDGEVRPWDPLEDRRDRREAAVAPERAGSGSSEHAAEQVADAAEAALRAKGPLGLTALYREALKHEEDLNGLIRQAAGGRVGGRGGGRGGGMPVALKRVLKDFSDRFRLPSRGPIELAGATVRSESTPSSGPPPSPSPRPKTPPGEASTQVLDRVRQCLSANGPLGTAALYRAVRDLDLDVDVAALLRSAVADMPGKAPHVRLRALVRATPDRFTEPREGVFTLAEAGGDALGEAVVTAAQPGPAVAAAPTHRSKTGEELARRQGWVGPDLIWRLYDWLDEEWFDDGHGREGADFGQVTDAARERFADAQTTRKSIAATLYLLHRSEALELSKDGATTRARKLVYLEDAPTTARMLATRLIGMLDGDGADLVELLAPDAELADIVREAVQTPA